MSDCGCDQAPGAPCGCADTATDAAHGAALTLGESVGTLVAKLAAGVTFGMGAGGRTHARNQTLAGLGFPYVSTDGRLVSPGDPIGIAVGFGLDLDAATPGQTRSVGWRQKAIPLDVPRG